MHYSFEISDAQKYGVDEAIFIQNLRFWILKNKASGKHEYNGKTWTYNSAQSFAKLFPFWTNRQVERITKSLKDKNIVTTGNYNSSHYDRTLWYAFCDENLFLNGVVANTQSQNSIYANAEIKKHDQVNLYQIVNTDINTDTNTVPSVLSTSQEPIGNSSNKTLKDDFLQNRQSVSLSAQKEFSPDFERFYRAYPVRVDKGKSHTAFLKHKFSSAQVDELIHIATGQAKQKKMIADTGCFIARMRNCATWLNQKGWEDGIMGKEDIKQLILSHLDSKKILSHAEESKIREALEDDEAEIIEHNEEGDY